MDAAEHRTKFWAGSLSGSQKVALLCVLYTAFAAIVFPSTYLNVLRAAPILRFYLVMPFLLIVGLLLAALINAPRTPLKFMRAKLNDRGMGALLIFTVLVFTASAFTTLKHEYSLFVSFFADPILADIDAAIHFGDPWRHARSVTPAALDTILYSLYSQLWFVQIAGVILYASFIANRGQREAYFASFVMSVILLSSIVRLIGSSGGPVFYDRLMGGTRFADLIAALQNSTAGPRTLKLTDYLYTSYSTERSVLGTGISAMPSLHVALAFLNALFLTTRNKIVGKLAWLYFAIIMFGSVYFGWHYAVDGYVSIAVVAVIWHYAKSYLNQTPSKV
jgi:PAP2 superfamily